MRTITLANLHLATAQQIFDQVASHLLRQGEPAREESGACRYRTASGLKCAAGCLISDEEYDKSFEGKGWVRLCQEKGLSMEHYSLIDALQRIHDHQPTTYWSDYLRDLAHSAGLQYKANEYGKTRN